MSAEALPSPQLSQANESKSARKKRTKSDAPASASDVVSPTEHVTESEEVKVNNGEMVIESSYVKELQKSIRNVNKKLNSMQKVDSILAENPNQSLDELVAARKINNDQKAQALKKPALKAQLAQLEDQIAQYRKFDHEYQERIAAERELLQRAHRDELEKLRDTLKAEAEIEAQKTFRQRLLTLSRFLRAAAARRQREDDESEETKAFEGALLLIYGGDATAVAAAERLIEGADEKVPSTEGILLNVTYAQINRAALEDAPFAAEEAWAEGVAQAEPNTPEVDGPALVNTDLPAATAGMTEMDTQIPYRNGGSVEQQIANIPEQATIGAAGANATAEELWDRKEPGSDEMGESFEIIPRDPGETENNPPSATAVSSTSWADDAMVEPPAVANPTPATNGNDGFSEVHHNRGGRGRPSHGGPRGRGGPRGEGQYRGRRGGYRFRGGRGREGPQ